MSKMIPLHVADQAVAACNREIEKLQQENSGLRAAVESHERVDNLTIASLKAEVERLRKAGDAMQKSMLECGPNEMATAFHYDEWWVSYYGWNAAKEGKSSV